jgi:hypothetical protein
MKTNKEAFDAACEYADLEINRTVQLEVVRSIHLPMVRGFDRAVERFVDGPVFLAVYNAIERESRR